MKGPGLNSMNFIYLEPHGRMLVDTLHFGGGRYSDRPVRVYEENFAHTKRRKWKPGQKALIVLEGLKGRPIGELCAEHEISQAQYYQWRDQLLANAAKAFEPAGAPERQGRLERENARLKSLVGELTLELKKSEEVLG